MEGARRYPAGPGTEGLHGQFLRADGIISHRHPLVLEVARHRNRSSCPGFRLPLGRLRTPPWFGRVQVSHHWPVYRALGLEFQPVHSASRRNSQIGLRKTSEGVNYLPSVRQENLGPLHRPAHAVPDQQAGSAAAEEDGYSNAHGDPELLPRQSERQIPRRYVRLAGIAPGPEPQRGMFSYNPHEIGGGGQRPLACLLGDGKHVVRLSEQSHHPIEVFGRTFTSLRPHRRLKKRERGRV